MLNTDCTVFRQQRIDGGGSKILDCIVLWVSKEKGVPKYGYTLKNGICYQDDADPYDCSVSNCDFCPNSAECTQCEK